MRKDWPSLEVRLQAHQVDRHGEVRREATAEFLAGLRVKRVRLLRQVNPTVDHPRWSQAQERRIGEFFMRKTLMFNGCADQVASLYTGMDLRKDY